MNARIAAVLVALLVLLGGGALYYQHLQRAERPGGAGALGKPLLAGLKVADIAQIAIREPQGAVTLEKKDASWAIPERGGFPADVERVREFLLKAIELKVGQAEPVGAADRKRLQLDEGATRVEFRGADGKPLAALLVGRKYFKGEPENPDKAAGDGRFVMVPRDETTVYVVSDPLAQATAKTSAWISHAGFSAEKAKSVEMARPAGDGWKIERAAEDAEWKLAGARDGEKLEMPKANAAAYALANLDVADVAPKDAKPEETGLAAPAVLTAETFDGLTYTLKVGAANGDNYYATAAVAGEPKPQGKDAEERAKKLAERLPRERALAGHTLLVAKSRIEDALKARSELLAKPEPKDKAEAGARIDKPPAKRKR
jgi:hypothetical protein